MIARHRIAAGALVVDGDRILLVHHVQPGRYDFWIAPGGAVEEGEELAETAAREVREETGLVVEIGDLAYVDDLLIGTDLRQCKLWFLARQIGGVLAEPSAAARAENIVETAFLSTREMSGKLVFPPVVMDEFWIHLREGFTQPRFFGVRNAMVV